MRFFLLFISFIILLSFESILAKNRCLQICFVHKNAQIKIRELEYLSEKKIFYEQRAYQHMKYFLQACEELKIYTQQTPNPEFIERSMFTDKDSQLIIGELVKDTSVAIFLVDTVPSKILNLIWDKICRTFSYSGDMLYMGFIEIPKEVSEEMKILRPNNYEYIRIKSHIYYTHKAISSVRVIPEVAMKFYIIKEGDWLSKVAEKFYGKENYDKWEKIYEANRDKIKDPNLIYPGMEIKVEIPIE